MGATKKAKGKPVEELIAETEAFQVNSGDATIEMQVSAQGAGVSRPDNLQRAFIVAVCRGRLMTQAEAAKQAGVDERTVRRWEASDWWAEMQEAAWQKWLQYGDRVALDSAMKALEGGDGLMTRWYLERRRREFAPPVKDAVLPGSGSVVVPTQINVYLPDNKRDVRAEVVASNGKAD